MLKKITTRELEVLKLVCEGKTNPEISKKLWITTHTVKVHISSILEKLEFRNRTELAYQMGKLQLF